MVKKHDGVKKKIADDTYINISFNLSYENFIIYI